MVFLSFNPAVTPADVLHEDEGYNDLSGEEPAPDLPLHGRWVFWQQLMSSGGKSLPYSQSTRQIAECETVQEFWQAWQRLPQPSELMANRMVLNVADGFHVVDALMLFRENVAPQWEDPMNADGGHFQFQFKASIGGGQIDEYWNNLVLGVIGATIEPADMITGLRLVDKLSGPRSASNLRVEVWFSQLRDTAAVELLRRNVERCVSTRTFEGRIGPQVVKPEMKVHKMTRHQ